MNLQDLAALSNLSSAFGLSIGDLPKLTGLLKFRDLKTDQITVPVLNELAGSIGWKINADESLKQEVASYMQANNVHGIADMVQSKDLVNGFKALLEMRREHNDTNMIVCPHCNEYINPQSA